MIERGWAIVGECGLYTGWWFSRQEAIDAFCLEVGETWQQRKKAVDRAVKINIYY
jgi:hypothetical protein